MHTYQINALSLWFAIIVLQDGLRHQIIVAESPLYLTINISASILVGDSLNVHFMHGILKDSSSMTWPIVT